MNCYEIDELIIEPKKRYNIFDNRRAKIIK
jgi:hypothetical protein